MRTLLDERALGVQHGDHLPSDPVRVVGRRDHVVPGRVGVVQELSDGSQGDGVAVDVQAAVLGQQLDPREVGAMSVAQVPPDVRKNTSTISCNSRGDA